MPTTKTQYVLTEFNGVTGKTTQRELSADEIADRESQAVEIKAQEATATAKADARTSALNKLSALGLTQEEIDSL